MRAQKIDTITIKIPHNIVAQVDLLAKKQDRSRSAVIRKALQEYLEDLQDVKDAEKIITDYEKDPKKKVISFEQMLKSFNITKKDLEKFTDDDFKDCD